MSYIQIKKSDNRKDDFFFANRDLLVMAKKELPEDDYYELLDEIKDYCDEKLDEQD